MGYSRRKGGGVFGDSKVGIGRGVAAEKDEGGGRYDEEGIRIAVGGVGKEDPSSIDTSRLLILCESLS